VPPFAPALINATCCLSKSRAFRCFESGPFAKTQLALRIDRKLPRPPINSGRGKGSIRGGTYDATGAIAERHYFEANRPGTWNSPSHVLMSNAKRAMVWTRKGWPFYTPGTVEALLNKSALSKTAGTSEIVRVVARDHHPARERSTSRRNAKLPRIPICEPRRRTC